MSMLLAAKALQIEMDNPVRKLILIKLADNADDSGVCWPSYSYLARLSGCSVRTAQRHVKWLSDNDFLSIKYRKKENGDNQSNVYFLTVEKGIKHLEKTEGGSVTVSPPLVSHCHPPGVTVSPPWCHSDTPLASQCHPEPVIESINEPINEPVSNNAREIDSDISGFELQPSNKKTTKPKQPKINIPFEEVWKAYGHGVGNIKTLKKKWRSLSDEDRQEIKKHIPPYVESTSGDEIRFRADFENYLSRQVWKRPIPKPKGASNANSQRDNKQSAYEQLTNGQFKPYEPFRVDSNPSGATLDGEVIHDVNGHLPSLAQQH